MRKRLPRGIAEFGFEERIDFVSSFLRGGSGGRPAKECALTLDTANELIKVEGRTVGNEAVQTVNARELHGFLGVGKVFAAWIQDRIQQYGFVEDSDFVITLSKTGIRQNVIQKDYHLTIDMAKELSMVERNEKGKQARQYFLARKGDREPWGPASSLVRTTAYPGFLPKKGNTPKGVDHAQSTT